MNTSQQIYVALGVLFLAIGLGGAYMLSKDEPEASQDLYYSEDQKVQETTADTNPDVTIIPSATAIPSDDLDNPGNTRENGRMTIEEKSKVQKPEMQIDKTKSYTAVIKTSQGDMTVKLYADKVPVTVNNFVALSKMGFYTDVIFHRVIKGFMIQGGDPTGTGRGGPAYKFDDETFDGEYKKGTIAMANAGPNTNGSQFFIMHGDVALPKNYVIFGEVTQGLDVVDKIATQPVKDSGMGEASTPVNPTVIQNVEVTEK